MDSWRQRAMQRVLEQTQRSCRSLKTLTLLTMLLHPISRGEYDSVLQVEARRCSWSDTCILTLRYIQEAEQVDHAAPECCA